MENIAKAENARCCVIVPYYGNIDPLCDRSLVALELRGYKVNRVYGISDISRGRSWLASEYLSKGFEEMMWIDSDVRFNPDDIEKLRAHKLPIVGGACVRKGGSGIACSFLDEKQRVTFGEKGGLFEVRYIGTGFLYTRSEVYHAIKRKLKLNGYIDYGRTTYGFFQHVYKGNGRKRVCLGEDYSFCERALRAGFRLMIDTSIRLAHVGPYPYSWEDIEERPRVKSIEIEINQQIQH
jgi:hypothetical protein